MVKFLHLSDTHLGASNFKLAEREKDFEKVFSQAISFALDQKVDFVIHSGDLFDRAKPSMQTLLFAIEELKRLKEGGIPFLIVPGSHDLGVEGTMISILEKVGLLTNLGDERFLEEKDGRILLKGEKIGQVFICGLAGKRAGIRETYSCLQPLIQESNFRIFLFHHIVSLVPGTELFADIELDSLPQGFDYYAGGHWHSKFLTQRGDSLIAYPGSSEYTNLSEMEKDEEKGFFFFEEGNLKWVKLDTRQIIIKKVDCNNLSPEEVTKICLQKIVPGKEGAILIFKLIGRLGRGMKSEIDRTKVNRVGVEKGYLITKMYLTNLQNPLSKEVAAVKRRTLEEIEEEYLLAQKYSEKTIAVAKEIIRILGQEIPPAEVEKAQIEIAQLIERELL
jgi:DNA repair exonuclease SbcCD nuclease subunit